MGRGGSLVLFWWFLVHVGRFCDFSWSILCVGTFGTFGEVFWYIFGVFLGTFRVWLVFKLLGAGDTWNPEKFYCLWQATSFVPRGGEPQGTNSHLRASVGP